MQSNRSANLLIRAKKAIVQNVAEELEVIIISVVRKMNQRN